MQKLKALISDSNVQSCCNSSIWVDRSLAKSLLEAFILVSRDDFYLNLLRAMLIRRSPKRMLMEGSPVR